MHLTERLVDALSEVINISYGRTADSLSQITGSQVGLDVPRVELRAASELEEALAAVIREEIIGVHQSFGGSLTGDALLVLSRKNALVLANALGGGRDGYGGFGASEREVLLELGNILLNACLGSLGNVLEVVVVFSVPRLHVRSVEELLGSLATPASADRMAMIVCTRFSLIDRDLTGFVVLVLGVTSLERLADAVDGWARTQLAGPS